MSDETGHLCPTDILKSFGLTGMTNPALKESFVDVCENMTYNCCTTNDLNILQTVWEDYNTKI